MHSTLFFRRVLLGSALLLGGWVVRGQTPAPAPTAVPTPALVERTVYTPYEQLEQVFQKEDRGVFLPYREFLDLWNKLNLPADLKKGNVPPVDGVLASARYTGRVEGDAAVFDAQLQLEALKEGWSKIPLGAADLNIAEVKPGAAAGAGPTLHLAEGGYEAIVPAKGSYALPLTVLGKVVRDAGQATLRLSLPRTAASQFELTIPETGLDFVLTPASAFTTKEENGATRLAAFFGTTQEVSVAWRKRAAETTLPPLVFVETTLGTSVTPGVLRTTATLDFRILRAGVSQFRLLFPANVQVLTVEGTDLRDWNQDGNGPTIPEGRQRILVNLASPARDRYRLRVTLEAAVPGLPAKLSVPGVEVEGAEGQSGTITLAADPSLTVAVDPRQGVTQQGIASPTAAAEKAGEQPGAEAAPAGTFLGAYRFLRLPYAVDLAAQAAEPVVEVEAATLYTVTPDLLEARTAFKYSVKKAGIFAAMIDVPGGWTHVAAVGEPVENYAVVPTPPGAAPGTQRLEVRFKERQMDRFGFEVTADAPRSRPDEPLTAALPRPVGAARVEGSLAVAVNTSLDPNTTAPGDVHQTDVGEISAPAPRDSAKNPVTLGFRYRGDSPKPPVVAFTQRKPRVTAEVRSRVALHESLVAYRWTVAYRIEYAGVDEFVIDAPPEVADDLQFDGLNIKEKAREEEKDTAGKPTGRKWWHVRLQQKQTDNYALQISVERPLPALSAGKTASVPWPELKTVGIFHETGTVAVVKDGNLEITHATPTGLELIDPKELAGDDVVAPNRGGAAGPEEVFLAYRYAAHPALLTLEFSKNEFLPVPTALVTYAVINTVLTTDQAETTEAIYWVRNNGRQFLSVVLPERGQMLSDVFVNGVGQQPSRRPDKNALLVRLPARVAGTGVAESNNANDAPVSVRLVYAVPSAEPGRGGLHARGHLRFAPPTLEDTRVLQTEVSLYLPAGYRYVRFEGAMREVYTSPGWTRWRGGLEPLVPSLGPDPAYEPAAQWQTPPTLPTTTGSGFDSVVPKEGTPVVLRRLDAPAPVDIAYRSLGYANTVEALAFFLALLGGLALLGSSRGARLAYFFVVGVGAMIVAGAVMPRAAGGWTAIYLGVLLAAFVWLLSWPVGFVRRLSHRVREGRRRLRVWAGERLRRRPPGGGSSGGGNPPPPSSPPEPPVVPAPTSAA